MVATGTLLSSESTVNSTNSTLTVEETVVRYPLKALIRYFWYTVSDICLSPLFFMQKVKLHLLKLFLSQGVIQKNFQLPGLLLLDHFKLLSAATTTLIEVGIE